jgi:hypothetical protein
MTTPVPHIALTVGPDGEQLTGELALAVSPGTSADVQSRLIDDVLDGPLSDHARALGVVLDAAPARFTRGLPGKDAEGRVRFSVRARVEGDRLVPNHPSNKRK